MMRKTMTRHGTTRGDTLQIWVRWEFGNTMRTLESKALRVMTMTKTKGMGGSEEGDSSVNAKTVEQRKTGRGGGKKTK